MNAVFWRTVLQMLVLIPATVSIVQVSHNFLRRPVPSTALLCAAIELPAAFLLGALTAQNIIGPAVAAAAACIVLLIVCRLVTTLEWPPLLAQYVGVLAIETYPLQFAFMLDARLHPESGAASMSVEAAGFQLVLALVLMAAFSYSALFQFSVLFGEADLGRVWYLTAAISALFLVPNIFITPLSYSTLEAGRTADVYPLLESVAFTILTLTYVLFYKGAVLLIERARLRERSQILEIEARSYRTLRRYMNETTRLRHDFRHSVRVLSSLAQAGDLDSLRAYLESYDRSVLDTPPASYCKNAALNALFEYYVGAAEEQSIDTRLELDLPDPLPIPELDLVSVFGNLMDNAIAGCALLPPGSRRLRLTTAVHGNHLYIVTTNTFDGHVRKRSDQFLSTKHSGRGTGLASITAIADRCGGQASFSSNGKEFCADIVLRLQDDPLC